MFDDALPCRGMDPARTRRMTVLGVANGWAKRPPICLGVPQVGGGCFAPTGVACSVSSALLRVFRDL